jgi:hypothetical protein
MPVLSNSDQFNLKEAKTLVKNFLLSLLDFTNNEKKFLEYFVQNRYEPELLFTEDKVLKRIQHHPMALWRTNQK